MTQKEKSESVSSPSANVTRIWVLPAPVAPSLTDANRGLWGHPVKCAVAVTLGNGNNGINGLNGLNGLGSIKRGF